MKIPCLNKRHEFAHVAKNGKKFVCASFIMQACAPPDGLPNQASRFGYIVTKKNGGAVQRNLIKRRFKSIVQAQIKHNAVTPFDYVIIARPGCILHEFSALEERFAKAFSFFRPKNTEK